MEGPSQSSQATLCRNGCGFYGNSKNDGMCSKCYKETVQKKNNSGIKSPGSTHSSSKDKANNSPVDDTNQSDGVVENAMATLATNYSSVTNGSVPSETPSSSQPVAIPTAINPVTSSASPAPETTSFNEAGPSADESNSSSKPKKNRCATCRKRLGLTGFYCRCGKIFCSLHRYSDQHDCDFDYKADAQAKIRKENPLVVGEKINKI